MRLGRICKYRLNLRMSLRTSAFVFFGAFSFFLYISGRGVFFFPLDPHDGTVFVVATLLFAAKLTRSEHHLIR